MGNASGNHKYVIYMKKGDLDQLKNAQLITSFSKKNSFVLISLNYLKVGRIKTGSNSNEFFFGVT